MSHRPPHSRVTVRPFGTLADGRPADLYTLTAPSGASLDVTTYGGIVTALRVPDRDGQLGDVVLGYDRLEDYVRDRSFFGAVIGRYANRIAFGRFVLDGREVRLETNDPPHHLHGGSQGFHKTLWTAQAVEDAPGAGVRLRHRSPDGHGGYPGNLDVTVLYVLTDDGALAVDYEAMADRDTIVNLTHHGYFNLGGTGGADVLDHVVALRARRFTPADATLIPTGEVRDVRGTPLDFTEPSRIGDRIDADDEQLRAAGGYDHNWVVDGGGLAPVARIGCLATGRMLEVATTEPGVQFYTGNMLTPGTGKGGAPFGPRSAFCLETQHFPDSPNKPQFPSVVVRAGQRYRSKTVYRFGTFAEAGDLRFPA